MYVCIENDCGSCVIKWNTERKFSLARDVRFVEATFQCTERRNNVLLFRHALQCIRIGECDTGFSNGTYVTAIGTKVSVPETWMRYPCIYRERNNMRDVIFTRLLLENG